MGDAPNSYETKRVVLLAAPGAPTRIVFHALAGSLPISDVVLEESVARTQLIRGRLKRLGAPTVAGQLLFQGLVVPALKRSASRRLDEIHREYGFDDSPIHHSSVHHVRSANDEQTIELLGRLRPGVVAVQGTRILSRRLLEAVGCPFINMHAGLTPMYRGVHGGYWALAEGKPEHCGVTVHLVDPGVDTGGILAQSKIEVTARDSFVTYPYLQLGQGLPLMIDALRAALEGRLKPVTVSHAGASRAWSHPTAWGYALRRLRGVR